MLSTERSIAMSDHSRRVLTPGASRKRKEREGFDALKAPTVTSATPTISKAEPATANRLLAGYLAHEFLTQGTLFGQKWDPARAQAAPVSVVVTTTTTAAAATGETKKKVNRSYAEVANLLKMDGVHIPGIVNPTQLERWIQM